MKVSPPIRDNDKFGSGLYGASRDGGKRTHKGIDYACYPNSMVLSVTSGVVTKLGYPYKDDPTYRYVEVTDHDLRRFRYFYVKPTVSMNQMVIKGGILGKSQELNRRYNGITEHVHLEVKDQHNEFLDPGEYIT